MGKKFKGKPCAYCGEPGGTSDHVFARGFFPAKSRADLPQVSACERCNNKKSELEHYVLSVLPFAGNHPDITDVLTSDIPGRLDRNKKLTDELAGSKRKVILQTDEGPYSRLTLPFNQQKFTRLVEFITKGLVQYYWPQCVRHDYYAIAMLLQSREAREFEQLMKRSVIAEARGNLGNGLILYQGVQTIDKPLATIWRFRIYGLTLFLDELDESTRPFSGIWSFTSDKSKWARAIT